MYIFLNVILIFKSFLKLFEKFSKMTGRRFHVDNDKFNARRKIFYDRTEGFFFMERIIEYQF